MNTLVIGKSTPAFTLASTNGEKIRLSSLKGHNVVLYFYPRDATPGCTLESQDFRDAFEAFGQCDTIILGISQDPMKSHLKFREKQALPFQLLSDEDGVVCTKYGVLKEKKMYGKTFIGIERSTFLIDKKGKLREQWRKVKVPEHVEAVLAAAQAL